MSKEKEVAVKAAKEAGKVLMKYFGKNLGFDYKVGADIVTKADLESEALIKEMIGKNFSEHKIFAEESGREEKKSEFEWIIDPLDGTYNFVSGVPTFAVSIALVTDKKPVLAVVFDPVHEELFVAEKGKGAFLNGSKISVSKTTDFKDSVIEFDGGYNGNEKALNSAKVFQKNIRTFRFYQSTVIELSRVACGRADAVIHFDTRPWDCATGVLLVEEAGGQVTNFHGKDFDVFQRNFVASNGKLHEKILGFLEGEIK